MLAITNRIHWKCFSVNRDEEKAKLDEVWKDVLCVLCRKREALERKTTKKSKEAIDVSREELNKACSKWDQEEVKNLTARSEIKANRSIKYLYFNIKSITVSLFK
ncbi:hypothetical protein chiPu_0018057 [Chiloscyllium punctatum]|uniref:Uncharacterized protein n=1 Tax=Chiloscyllium punctatum TaxID=137246 RepID=A0A401RKV3_CHIPU|nr:hypothetical protein [Chiloscyllium punctatum]